MPADRPLSAHDRLPVPREACLDRDRSDPLREVRNRFRLPENLIYLDGMSLGALPSGVGPAVARVVEQEWGCGLIRSWNDAGWIDAPRRVGERIAPLVGAGPGQVLLADSTTINLHKLLHAALQLRPSRRRIVTEQANFPTDLYAAASCPGVEAVMVPREKLREALDERTAVLFLTHVDYRSSFMHDMEELTRAAHAAGAVVVWDLSHSTGAVELQLDAWQVDLATGCGYKFLHGGPGAPAYLYVATRHQDSITPSLPGWMGDARPFAFAPDYEPAPGVDRMLTGTPSIVALAALEAALEVFEGLEMRTVRDKGKALGRMMIDLVRGCPSLKEVRLVSPEDADERGGHVALGHPAGYAVMQALIAEGVIGDFREPDVMRFGLDPLTTRFADVWDAVDRLEAILAESRWDRDEFRRRSKVT